MKKYSKGEFRGMKSVFRFTLRTLFKSKSNIAMLILIFVLSAGGMLVLGIIGGTGSKAGVINVDKISQIADVIGSDIGEEGSEALLKGVSVTVDTVSGFEGGKSSVNSDATMIVQMIYSIIILMLCVLAITNVVSMVVEEKDSKLIEFIMVNIRPVALLGGKIIAVMIFALIEVLVLAMGAILGLLIGGVVTSLPMLTLLSAMGLNLGAVSIIALVVFMLVGFATYSLVASVSAAGCSTVEDINSAMSLSMILVMLGFIISMGAGTIGGSTLVTVFSILPFFAPFVAPAQFVMGNVGVGIMLISLAVQILVVVFLTYLAARTYEATVVYRGERLKLSKVLKMTFGRRTA